MSNATTLESLQIESSRPGRVTASAAARLLPRPATAKWPQGEFDATVFERGDGASALFFAPRGTDCQSPHDRDELYVVITGTGEMEVGSETIAYQPGDLIFVPRNVPHRFLVPPEDLALWVVFLPADTSR